MVFKCVGWFFFGDSIRNSLCLGLGYYVLGILKSLVELFDRFFGGKG